MLATIETAPTSLDRSPFSFAERRSNAHTPYGLPIVDNCMSCKLHGSSFFCSLSPATMSALNRIKHATCFPAGSVVFLEGQDANGVYIVCQGRVKLLTTNADGRTLILKVAEPGEVLGLHSAVTGRPHELTVETIQPSQLAFVRRDDFVRFLMENGDACLRAAEYLAKDCQAAYDTIRSVGLCHSASEKLARLLLHWASDGRAENGSIRLKVAMTHEEMAQLIGTSRETVTRTLSDFKKRRLLEINGSTLVIHNKAALERVAN
jgi:CRP/FNR family transcriptional regulator, cyclic AMP receptor protein